MNKLITANKIRNNSLVDSNVTERDISNAILLAQKIDLQRLLSYELFTEILEDDPDSNLDEFISDYMTDLLEYYTVKQLLIIKYAKITAAGTSKDNNDSNISLELAEKRAVMSDLDSIISPFESLLLDYIRDNSDIFTEYYDDDEEYNGVTSAPTTTVFDMRTLNLRR